MSKRLPLISLMIFGVIVTGFSCVQKKSVEVASNNPPSVRKASTADKYQHSDFRRISAMTARLLDRNHYSAMPMDKKLSNRIFDIFFDTLDPMHIFFTASDVESFAIYRDNIGRQLQYGEYQFAFSVYELYRKRYAQYRKFTGDMLAQKIDFTVNEEIELDSSKEQRPADENAMKELWRKQIKNELLSLRLSARLEAEERENTPEAAATPAPTLRTPTERILQRQRDVGNNIDQRDRIDILGVLLDCMAQSYGAHSDYHCR